MATEGRLHCQVQIISSGPSSLVASRGLVMAHKLTRDPGEHSDILIVSDFCSSSITTGLNLNTSQGKGYPAGKIASLAELRLISHAARAIAQIEQKGYNISWHPGLISYFANQARFFLKRLQSTPTKLQARKFQGPLFKSETSFLSVYPESRKGKSAHTGPAYKAG